MKDVPIEKIVPGTQLAASLINEQGTMILNRGTRLTASVLNRLQRIGVQALPISTDPETLQRERNELLAALQERFQGTEKNAFLQELKRLAITHLTQDDTDSSTRTAP